MACTALQLTTAKFRLSKVVMAPGMGLAAESMGDRRVTPVRSDMHTLQLYREACRGAKNVKQPSMNRLCKINLVTVVRSRESYVIL